MVEWFKHDFKARTHPRLQRIQMKYGMEGVGIYWSLIEMLYEEDGRLMLSECDAYAFALRMDSEPLADFVKGCGAFIFEGDVFYSDTVHERMQERAEKSEKASNNAKKRWINASAMQTHSGGNAIREEKSREDKSRKEKTKSAGYPPDFDLAWELYKRKGSKKLALTEWNNLSADEKKKVHAHIPAYIGNTEPKYVKDFERYLKHGKYESETVQTQAKSSYMTYSEVLVTMHKEGLAMNRFVCLNGENGNPKTIGDKGEPMWRRK